MQSAGLNILVGCALLRNHYIACMRQVQLVLGVPLWLSELALPLEETIASGRQHASNQLRATCSTVAMSQEAMLAGRIPCESNDELSSLAMFYGHSQFNLSKQASGSKRTRASGVYSRSIEGRIAIGSRVAGQPRELRDWFRQQCSQQER